jgi:hypothetical protein
MDLAGRSGQRDGASGHTLEKTTLGSCVVSEGLPVPGIPLVAAGTAAACSPSAPPERGSAPRPCCADSAAVWSDESDVVYWSERELHVN